MTYPWNVRIVEVGPRDGLQNEPSPISVADKVELIGRLADAGLAAIEAGAFVSPRWVPQMAGSAEVYAALERRPGLSYPALVPNMKGFEAAVAAGVEEIAVFVSASEGFSRKNIACSRAESLERLAPVAEAAIGKGMKVRGYVSCIVACPYDGAVPPVEVRAMAAALADLGCYEISLGDTTGVGTAEKVRAVIAEVSRSVARERIAMHFHDTYGQGVANVLVSLGEGVAVFDSSVGGLGGCPYAPGASGNVATEDVLYLLDGMGISTGADLVAVARAGAWISARLGREHGSRAGRAVLAATAPGEG